MIAFAKRNILLYIRDRTAVFFSLLAVFILIMLYVVFLGDLITGSLPDLPSKNWLLMSWIFSGILAITSVTTTMGAMGTMVEDRSNKRILDFYASPIARSKLFGGYIISSITIGFIMCILALIAANGFQVFSGESSLSFMSILRITGIILLSVLSSASMILLLVSFFQTANAFIAASTVVGTLIGFLAGIYIPIGTLPGYLQTVIQLFPTSHAAALFRQHLMDAPLQVAFFNAPAAVTDEFLVNMGVYFEWNGKRLSSLFSIFYLMGTTIIFYLLTLFITRLLNKRMS